MTVTAALLMVCLILLDVPTVISRFLFRILTLVVIELVVVIVLVKKSSSISSSSSSDSSDSSCSSRQLHTQA